MDKTSYIILHACIGRLLYGFIMDKTSYKVAMTIESTLLMLLVSTFYLTSIIGNNHVVERSWNYLVNICRWFYFKISIPKTLNWQFLQLDLEFSSTQSCSIVYFVKESVSVIFQYGGAQCEWSSSLNRCPPRTSSFFWARIKVTGHSKIEFFIVYAIDHFKKQN